MRVRCNSKDKISMERGGIFEVTFGCESQRSLLRLLKITSVFNHLGAQRTHRGVFVRRVAKWH